MTGRLDWVRDGRDWPNRAASQFVEAAGFRWHVQRMGDGPALLLLHGTGASTHSWHALAPLLAERFTVIAPDLPGHGFTDMPPYGGLKLPGMAHGIAALLQTLNVSPRLAVGHSAGAAILARMSLDELIAPKAIISLNGALLPFEGLAGHIFSPLAKVLFLNPVAPHVLTWRARDRATVERLIHGTGSPIDAAGIDLYARLFRSSDHVAAALGMMAHWDLHSLERDLPRLETPLVLVACGADRTIRPDNAFRVRDMVPGAEVAYVRNLGHLAHEEHAKRIADIVNQYACKEKEEMSPAA